MPSFHLPTLSTHFFLFSLLLLLSSSTTTNASLTPAPPRITHPNRSSSLSSPNKRNPGTAVQLDHNEAYHRFKREDGAGWLVREKAKLEHKYAEGMDGLGRRADTPVT